MSISYGLLYNMKNDNYFSRRQSKVWQRYLNPHPGCILHILKFWPEKKNAQKFTSGKLSTSYTVLDVFGMTWLKQSSLTHIFK